MAEPTVPRAADRTATGGEPTRSEETYIRPPVDIYEDDRGLVVLADLPGVEPEALDVQVDRRVLTIQAQATHPARADAVYREFALTGYFRQFQLPDDVDAAGISAELRHGVLTLRLPRIERAQARRIQVRTA